MSILKIYKIDTSQIILIGFKYIYNINQNIIENINFGTKLLLKNTKK